MYAMLARKAEGIRQDMAEFAEAMNTSENRAFDGRTRSATVERLMMEAGCDTAMTDAVGHGVGVSFGRSGAPALLLLDALSEPGNGQAGLKILLHGMLLLKRSLLPMQGHLAIATASDGNRQANMGVLLNETLPSLDIRPVCAIVETKTSADPADWEAKEERPYPQRSVRKGVDGHPKLDAFRLDAYGSCLCEAREALSDAGLDFGWENPRVSALGFVECGRERAEESGLPALLFEPTVGNGQVHATAAVGVDACVREAHRIAVVAYRLAGIPVCGWTLDEL